MLRTVSVIVATLILSNLTASAGVIRGAYVGCLTKQALDEFIGAAVKKDERQMSALLNRQCFAIEGREFSVVKTGFVKSQIRVYAGSDSVLLWVPTEATR
ncbi:MAG: hypothetical protein R3B94_11475 [Hyphomonas sp.]